MQTFLCSDSVVILKSRCLAAFYDVTGAVFYNVTAAMFLDITAVVFEDVTLTLYYAVRGFSCRVTQTHFQQECLNYPLMFEDSLMKRWNFGWIMNIKGLLLWNVTMGLQLWGPLIHNLVYLCLFEFKCQRTVTYSTLYYPLLITHNVIN